MRLFPPLFVQGLIGESTMEIRPLVSIRQLEALTGTKREIIFDLAEKAGNYYHPFDRKKPGSNKWRHIDNPEKDLKVLQRRISRGVLSRISFPASMVGGVGGKTIRDHASPHVGKSVVVAMDLRDCYPNINDKTVFRALQRELGCSPKIASILTELTTYHHRIPQGAPTSTAIANMVLKPLAQDLDRLAAKEELIFTMYIDDMAFSGYRAESIIEKAIRIIQRHGHAVRRKNTNVMRAHKPQRLVGLGINKRVVRESGKRRDLARRIVTLGNSKIQKRRDLVSVWSTVKWLENMDALQGAAMWRLATRYLGKPPTKNPKNPKKWKSALTRDCDSTKWHEYRPKRP